MANMAFIYNAMWMASNVTYAVENDRPVKEDQGRSLSQPLSSWSLCCSI